MVPECFDHWAAWAGRMSLFIRHNFSVHNPNALYANKQYVFIKCLKQSALIVRCQIKSRREFLTVVNKCHRMQNEGCCKDFSLIHFPKQ